MEHHRRHVVIWHIARPIVMLICLIRFNFRAKQNKIPGPYILISNHVTDWDPILLTAAFKNQMYYVASEHLMRLGWVSSLLNWLVAPIARQKGGSGAGAVKGMLRALKAGANVCVFAEGNRTWNGVTGVFPPSTGKLVRSSGASLVTYRLTGGYLSSPRWSGDSIRRGRMSGEVVKVYSPEELKAMTPAAINEAIASDIYENAGSRQQISPVHYRGKRLAEHLETYLFVCPACGALHTLKSSGNFIECTHCGAKAEYLDTGILSGNMGPETVEAWSALQEQRFPDILSAAGDGLVFTDSPLDCKKINPDHSVTELGSGAISLYRDRLELPGNVVIPAEKLNGVAVRGASLLFICTVDGDNYELKPLGVCNTVKYSDACRHLGYITSGV